MKKDFRGLMHIHSTYSFDGTLTLPEIKNLCIDKKFSFAVLTEHADGEHFMPEKMSEFTGECESLSDKDFVFIPGLEYECEGMHILAIGCKQYFIEKELEKLINKIRQNGGLSVLAHVCYYDTIPYEKLSNLSGIEVWNSRYDGRFSPSKKSLKILKKFRKQNKDIISYAGLDLHKKHSLDAIKTTVQSIELSNEEIIMALKESNFYSSNGFIRFNPKKDPTTTKKAVFALIGLTYLLLNKIRKGLSKILSTAGIKKPKTISNLSKKIFD